MNPIAFQSKESIVNSLFALMKKDKYELLTISEIATNANLDRRTFYRHFKSKEEVLSYYLRQSSNDYETAFGNMTVFDIRAITEVIFSVCFKRRKELKLLLKHNLSHLMLREISKLFPYYHKKFATKEELEHPHRDYMLSYHIGGFWNILNLWLTRGAKESPPEMANIIKEMLEINQI